MSQQTFRRIFNHVQYPLKTISPAVIWVRTSSECYPTFILAMDRSLGFGSTPSNYRPYQTRFRCASPIRLSSLLNVSR